VVIEGGRAVGLLVRLDGEACTRLVQLGPRAEVVALPHVVT
jgi:hypothetical protein